MQEENRKQIIEHLIPEEVSPREKRENEMVDNEMRTLINELLNARMIKPESTEEIINKLHSRWLAFCKKPRKIGLMGSTWKKVKPHKEAFKTQARHFISKFDTAQEDQLKEAPVMNKEPLNYRFK